MYIRQLAFPILIVLVAAACAGGRLPTPVSTSARPLGAPAADTTLPPATTPAPPTESAPATQGAWQVATLLVAPGEPGRMYALVTDGTGPLWAFPSTGVRLMTSDDFAVTWAPFPGGLPVAPDCMVNVNLDYATPAALYASTCQGLYAWNPDRAAWEQRSDQLTDVVAVAYGELDTLWAAAHGDGVIRSADGGRTWQDASEGLVTFGGMANLGIDPRENNTLYGIIRPQYAGSYLRRGTAEGNWVTMPTPQDNATIETGMAIDGGSGALYVTSQLAPVSLWRSSNPNTPNVDDVQWEQLHDFGSNVQASLLASGWGPQGPAIYANLWPLTPLAGGGASEGTPVLHRSLDGGQSWQPLPTP